MAGTGSATISGLPASYTPGGAAIPVTVAVNDSNFSTWGYQLSARLASNLNTQAGTFTAAGNNAANVSGGSVQGSGSSSTFSFTWTPPATAAGTVNFYLTGLATSSTNNNDLYSTTSTVSQAAAATPDFSLAASPSSVSVAQGAIGSSTMTVTPSNGFTGTVTYSASGLPSGVTASFSGNTLTLTASSTATTGGPTAVTITGMSGSLSHTTMVNLTVSAAAVTPNFSLSASPSSVTVAPASSGSTTITITPTGSFNDSTVSFSPPGLPAGLSATFGAISSTGTSKLTISATSSAAPMTIGVTVTGTSGSLSHSTSVNITVSSSTTSSALTAAPTALSFKYAGGSLPASQKLTVSDASEAVSFSASASGGSWLSVSPGSGTTSGSVMVSVNPSRMSAGTYTGSIQLSASGATGASVPVTLSITSSTCSDDCGGGGGGGGSTGTITAQPYVYDPNSSGAVTAVWIDRLGMLTNNQSTTHDPGLILSKNAGAPSGTLAGATIHNFTGSLTELGFDYRSGGQCTMTSPRFIVVTTDNITHVVGGCSKGTVTAAPMAGWNRVRFNLAETSQANPAITPGETVSSITLVLDLGPEAGASAAGGLVVIDNIYINNTYAVPSTRFTTDN
jgi:hypothetical protein